MMLHIGIFWGSNSSLYYISFDSDSETPNFSIGEVLYRLNEDNTIDIPITMCIDCFF